MIILGNALMLGGDVAALLTPSGTFLLTIEGHLITIEGALLTIH